MQRALGLDDPRGRQPLERAIDVDLRAIDRAKERGVERATDDGRRVQDPSVRGGYRVDAPQQELLQRFGERRPVREIDQRRRAFALHDHPAAREEPHRLLAVRRVALRALRDLTVDVA